MITGNTEKPPPPLCVVGVDGGAPVPPPLPVFWFVGTDVGVALALGFCVTVGWSVAVGCAVAVGFAVAVAAAVAVAVAVGEGLGVAVGLGVRVGLGVGLGVGVGVEVLVGLGVAVVVVEVEVFILNTLAPETSARTVGDCVLTVITSNNEPKSIMRHAIAGIIVAGVLTVPCQLLLRTSCLPWLD